MSSRQSQNRPGGKKKQNNAKSYNRTQSQPEPKSGMADQKVFNYTEAKEWMSEMWAEWSKKSDAETYQCNNSVKPRMKPSDQVIKELSNVAGC